MPTEIPAQMHDLLSNQWDEVETFVGTFLAEQLKPILASSRERVLRKLSKLRAEGADQMTITQYKKLLAEIQNAAFASGAELGEALDEGIDIASDIGFKNFVEQLSVAAAALGLNDPGDLVDLAKISGGSRLRQINEARKMLTADETSLYTTEQIATAERTIASVFIAGGTIDDAVAAIMSEMPKSPWATAEWKAERLARTELMRAMNATAVGSINEANEMGIPLGRQWYEFAVGPDWGEGINKPWPGPAAPMDNRVGKDSLRMHAQVVVGNQLFIDPGTKGQYAEAPSRPNGRETIIPYFLLDKDRQPVSF